MTPDISIVVPCYNEEEVIPIFYEETKKIIKTMPVSSYEFISLYMLSPLYLNFIIK